MGRVWHVVASLITEAYELGDLKTSPSDHMQIAVVMLS